MAKMDKIYMHIVSALDQETGNRTRHSTVREEETDPQPREKGPEDTKKQEVGPRPMDGKPTPRGVSRLKQPDQPDGDRSLAMEQPSMQWDPQLEWSMKGGRRPVEQDPNQVVTRASHEAAGQGGTRKETEPTPRTAERLEHERRCNMVDQLVQERGPPARGQVTQGVGTLKEVPKGKEKASPAQVVRLGQDGPVTLETPGHQDRTRATEFKDPPDPERVPMEGANVKIGTASIGRPTPNIPPQVPPNAPEFREASTPRRQSEGRAKSRQWEKDGLTQMLKQDQEVRDRRYQEELQHGTGQQTVGYHPGPVPVRSTVQDFMGGGPADNIPQAPSGLGPKGGPSTASAYRDYRPEEEQWQRARLWPGRQYSPAEMAEVVEAANTLQRYKDIVARQIYNQNNLEQSYFRPQSRAEASAHELRQSQRVNSPPRVDSRTQLREERSDDRRDRDQDYRDQDREKGRDFGDWYGGRSSRGYERDADRDRSRGHDGDQGRDRDLGEREYSKGRSPNRDGDRDRDREHDRGGGLGYRDRDRSRDRAPYQRDHRNFRDHPRGPPASKLVHYDGKQDWRVFEDQFEFLAERYRWEEEEKLNRLIEALRDRALTCWHDQPRHIKYNYQLLREKMNKRFGLTTVPFTVRRDIQDLEQKDGETLEEYAERARELTSDGYPRATDEMLEVIAVDAFLRGVKPKSVAMWAAQAQPTTLPAAVQAAKNAIGNQKVLYPDKNDKKLCKVQFGGSSSEEEEDSRYRGKVRSVGDSAGVGANMQELEKKMQELLKEQREILLRELGKRKDSSPGNSSADRVRPASPQRRQGNCYNCGAAGHFSRECTSTSPQRRRGSCYNCGAEGHFSRECTSPKKVLPPTPPKSTTGTRKALN